MNETQLEPLLRELLALPHETEWVEFKHNNTDPEAIGEYISALSNSATLNGKHVSYIVWGIDDRSHQIVGTNFKPRQLKVGNQELENWLITLLTPRLNFKIHEFNCDGKAIVMFEIPSATNVPTRFKSMEYI